MFSNNQKFTHQNTRCSLLLKLIIICIFCSFSFLSFASDSTLRYGESQRPDTLDPYTSREMSSLRLSELMFNGLISISEKQEIQSDLAESWIVNEDLSVFTFKLRKNVYWHRYKNKTVAFSAKDVVHTVKILQHPKSAVKNKFRFNSILSIEAIDEFTVKFTLKKANINGLALFNFKILPEHVLRKYSFLNKSNPFVNHPIGTGPFIFKKMNNNREITLIANQQYFLGIPKLKKIISKPFGDNNIMNQALSFNAIDMIVEVNPRHISELQADARFNLDAYNTLSYSFFAYNFMNKHLKLSKMRKAISYAINREEMLRAFFNNQGTIISGPFAPGSWAYNLDVQPDHYNPLKAIALLKEAGYTKTTIGFIDKQGKRLIFNLNIPIAKNNEATKRVVLAYKNFLHKIGIRINIKFAEREAWKTAIFRDHNFDITYASWSFDDASDITTLFHSSQSKKWGNNFISYNNKDVDSLIELNNTTFDLQEKRTISRRLHKILAAEAPYTFLWSLTRYAAYNLKFQNVNIHPYRFFDNVHLWNKD